MSDFYGEFGVKCRNCGLEHPGHVMCSMAKARAAINDAMKVAKDVIKVVDAASNSPVVASNTVEVASNSASNTVESASNTASNKKQRWDKAAYNAYMRDYMRKRRNG